ncbi:hypothetical protein RFI_28343 [Reticulomyxa filosa]|uniref:Serine aminopeptidase S33 domain-containing protein n=1 Tax=Reticulomyxa filosa TaxID=46433 RepID=X6M7N6_RETFI|nr:hypothetical protein RFI_28343 [Reticulomyxa filosa]|eukprot:ETO09045.1 hypothetical protein RFI_28343 [Reticulomyxa filosa]
MCFCCDILCAFSIITCCGCRNFVTRKLIFFPPTPSYKIVKSDEKDDEADLYRDYSLDKYEDEITEVNANLILQEIDKYALPHQLSVQKKHLKKKKKKNRTLIGISGVESDLVSIRPTSFGKVQQTTASNGNNVAEENKNEEQEKNKKVNDTELDLQKKHKSMISSDDSIVTANGTVLQTPHTTIENGPFDNKNNDNNNNNNNNNNKDGTTPLKNMNYSPGISAFDLNTSNEQYKFKLRKEYDIGTGTNFYEEFELQKGDFHFVYLTTKFQQTIPAYFVKHPLFRFLFISSFVGCSNFFFFFFFLKRAHYTILFSHGNAADIGLMRNHLLEMRKQIRVNIFAYEYTGYGRSTGKCSEKNTYADVEAAYHYLTKQLKIPPLRIVAFVFFLL